MKDVIHKVASLLEYKGEILNKPSRASDVISHNASNAKVKSMINYQLTSFEDGLAKTVEWYKENIKLIFLLKKCKMNLKKFLIVVGLQKGNL
ncbi:hypothetical protein PT520_08795 [Aliarcobacter butzleri]|uniref:NAD(P)-binding domain-containing protein n=1 Tax=Aliarcobacter butzleri TaxID=28197 RepID=A0AAW6VPP5_9BACT|nr:hypothetical protein [Aliarcobacter butzleri]MDK2062615.1 hypothetical protein [Aliarcobacter butzleri]